MDRHDLFISYKTEDTNAARAVAECLLANGPSVWFAEYQIPPPDYENEDAIRLRLQSGIRSSSNAVIFTNDRWSASDWCRAEMRWISEHVSPDRVAEVRIPPEDRPHLDWPMLANVPGMIYRAGHPEQVIAFLSDLEWFSPPLTPPAAPGLHDWRKHRFGICLPLDGFREVPDPAPIDGDLPRFTGETYFYSGSIEGLEVHAVVHINPFQTIVRDLAIQESGSVDDIQVYKRIFHAYRLFAEQWLGTQHREWTGTHLVFKQGRSSLAMTSRAVMVDGRASWWERRYALLLRDEYSGDTGELDLAFSVKLPEEDSRDFFQLTPFFDSIAQAAAYVPAHGWFYRERALPGEQVRERRRFNLDALSILCAKTSLCAASWYVFFGVAMPSGLRTDRMCIALFGAILADTVSAAHGERSRRDAELLGMIWAARLPQLGGRYDRLRDLAIGSIAGVIRGLLCGFVNPLTLGAIYFGLSQRIESLWFWGFLGAGAYLTGEIMLRGFTFGKRAWY